MCTVAQLARRVGWDQGRSPRKGRTQTVALSTAAGELQDGAKYLAEEAMVLQSGGQWVLQSSNANAYSYDPKLSFEPNTQVPMRTT